jgi:hypothetical protein
LPEAWWPTTAKFLMFSGVYTFMKMLERKID